MRELAYNQKNNNLYKYQLINSTQGIDLMPFVFKKSLNYSKFERTVDNKFSSNTMNFTLKFDYEVKEVFFKSEKLMYISSDLLKGYNLDSFVTTISEAPQVEGYILLNDIVKEGHVLSFTDEYRDIFEGIVEGVNFKRDNTGIYIDVSIKDKTNTLYELTYLKSYLYRDIYLSNNLDKDNSLLHQLGYLLGFKDDDLDIDDVKDSTNTYIKIPFVHLKKDELIIQDLAEAVRVTNSVYTIINNKLTIRLNENRLTETYRFDSRNILRELNKDIVIPDYEKIKVTYDRYFKKDLQDMWILQGENGTADNANIKILAGDTRRFNIKWFYNVSVVDNYEVYDVLISDLAGNAIEFKYDLSLDETGGILEFKNTSAIDLYVKSFKIRGIPLFMQSDNESYYPANIRSEKVLQLSNKFVQNYALAKLYSHIHYIDKCRSYRKFRFSTNVANFLETGVRIYFEHEDYKGYVIIERISFKGGRFEVEVREELEQPPISDLEYSEKTFVDEAEVLSKKYLEENGLYEKDKPLAPKNLILTAQFLGFDIEFEDSKTSLRGHYVYLRRKSETDFNRYFINTNKYFFETTERATFEVKVSSVSINGVEGDTTEVKEVIPLKLNDSCIEYPAGLSPSEIDDKVKINADDISKIDTEVQKKTTATEVEKITNTAIESFTANKFVRTLGTEISKIDYSRYISDDSLAELDIDSIDFKEVMITDYYSSLLQTSTQVLQAVRKGDIVSTINQTAEEVKINANRIEIGSGLVVEGDKVAVGNLTAESLKGKKLEGAEIISENKEKTERVYISSGKVVREKRNDEYEQYKPFEQLIMQRSGEVRCKNDWSPIIDFKKFNNNLPWSSLNLICFIGNQYDLGNGIATSREIVKEWIGDVNDQRLRIKVAGGLNTDTNQDIASYPCVNNKVSIASAISINMVYSIPAISWTQTVIIGYETIYKPLPNGGSFPYQSPIYGSETFFGTTTLYIKIDNEAEIKIAENNGSSPVSSTYVNDFGDSRKQIIIRKESIGKDGEVVSNVTLSGVVTVRGYNANKSFDCTVQWLAIGNS